MHVAIMAKKNYFPMVFLLLNEHITLKRYFFNITLKLTLMDTHII